MSILRKFVYILVIYSIYSDTIAITGYSARLHANLDSTKTIRRLRQRMVVMGLDNNSAAESTSSEKQIVLKSATYSIPTWEGKR